MKLVRFGEAGQEKPGVVDAAGAIRDVSAHVADYAGETGLSDDVFAKLRGLDLNSLPVVSADERIGAPVADVRNFIGIGLNYADHAAEAGLRIPREPVIFNKTGNCIVGPNDDVMIPKGSLKLDWEVELAFVIGKRARYVEEADAMSHIAGAFAFVMMCPKGTSRSNGPGSGRRANAVRRSGRLDRGW